MIRSLWDVFLTLMGNRDEEGETDSNSRFIPSPLDLSVRVGHGGRDDEVVRELEKVNEHARELQNSQRDQ
ncbi:hypothetical protein [Halobellus captivus]|uniref:hypothetical protein n=1 Tax=Halobellus captivus TaxID=2592614 RepID=UPI0011A5DFCF|nr:hypothetical protein [Halobellus captivus]